MSKGLKRTTIEWVSQTVDRLGGDTERAYRFVRRVLRARERRRRSSMGIWDRITLAPDIETIDALLETAKAFRYASAKTRRRWEGAARARRRELLERVT